MIVIGSNTSDNGQSRFTEDVSHFMELRQNRQLALLKRSAKNCLFSHPAARNYCRFLFLPIFGYYPLERKGALEFNLAT